MSENLINIKETIKDPLSEETRKSRKLLLAFSFIGIAIVHTGFIPTKIESMGIKFEKVDQDNILFLLGIVVSYFLLSFLVYAFSDFLIIRVNLLYNWKLIIDEKIKAIENGGKKFEAKYALDLALLNQNLRKEFQKFRIFGAISKFIYILRTSIEFIFPIIIAIYALYILF
jgi:hypothetical protein